MLKRTLYLKQPLIQLQLKPDSVSCTRLSLQNVKKVLSKASCTHPLTISCAKTQQILSVINQSVKFVVFFCLVKFQLQRALGYEVKYQPKHMTTLFPPVLLIYRQFATFDNYLSIQNFVSRGFLLGKMLPNLPSAPKALAFGGVTGYPGLHAKGNPAQK